MAGTGASSEPSVALILSQRDVMVVILFLVFLALVVVLQPFILSYTYRRQLDPTAPTQSDSPNKAHSFFETPYIPWFLVHNGMAALAMIVILILGLDAVIDKTTTAALLGSLFGYVLGSSSRNSQSTGQDGTSGKGKGSGGKPVNTPGPDVEPGAPPSLALRFTEENLTDLIKMAEDARKPGTSRSEPSES